MDDKPDLILLRIEFLENATLGLLFGPHPVWTPLHTMEKAWRDNLPRVSCIPEGRYTFIRSTFHRGGYECLELLDVPDRALIKIHRANWARQLRGCIAVGTEAGRLGGVRAVKNSRAALDALLKSLDDADEGSILVTNYVDYCKENLRGS